MTNQLTTRYKKLLYGLLLSACFLGSTNAQISTIPDSESQTGLGGVNQIIGYVFGPSGRPLERRVRIVLSTMARGNRTTVTGNNGAFAFKGLPNGSYTVSIDRETDFKPFTTSVEVIQFRGAPAHIITLNIRLESKTSEEAKPGVINSEFANVPKTALGLFNKAEQLAANRDYKAAIEQLELALVEHPAFMLAYNEIGVNYLRLNELNKADEALLRALSLNPEAFQPLMNRGIVLVTGKKYTEAEPVLRKALVAQKDSPVAHYFLGQALANLGKFEEAEKELGIAISTGGPEMKEAHRLRAILLSARGDKAGAATELETYLKLAPNTPDAARLKATIAQMRGDAAVPIEKKP